MQEGVERTLKTRKTLSRPNLQPAITPLSFFELKNRDTVSLALFGDILLYFRDGPGIGNMINRKDRRVNTAGSTHPINWFIASCTDLLRSSGSPPIYSPFEGATDVGAVQSKIDVILSIDHRVLLVCEPGTSRRRREENVPGSWRGGRRRGQRQSLLTWHLKPPLRDSMHRRPYSGRREQYHAPPVAGDCLP